MRAPPPRAGEEFCDSASRLAGFAGAFLGWTPAAFWRATPAELLAVVTALRGDSGDVPPDAATIARLREAFPDG
nr:phage tail assembly chaperone [Sphingomonas hylomeconis]